MISILSSYDNVTAAGILARMALALGGAGNPDARDRIPEEQHVRERILAEVRRTLGLAPNDDSPESIERLSEALDDESESLLGPLDLQAALANLSKKGQLPSDLYHVQISDQVTDFYGEKVEAERTYIEATVSAPDLEQHFSEPEPGTEGHLVSLFAKHFTEKYQYRNFTMLIMAQRIGTILTVIQAFRVYADRVNLLGVSDLVDVARRFSDEFGCEMEIDGKKGKFFVRADIVGEGSANTHINILPEFERDRRGRTRQASQNFAVTYFSQVKPRGGTIASMVIAVDLTKYRAALVAHGW